MVHNFFFFFSSILKAVNLASQGIQVVLYIERKWQKLSDVLKSVRRWTARSLSRFFSLCCFVSLCLKAQRRVRVRVRECEKIKWERKTDQEKDRLKGEREEASRWPMACFSLFPVMSWAVCSARRERRRCGTRLEASRGQKGSAVEDRLPLSWIVLIWTLHWPADV